MNNLRFKNLQLMESITSKKKNINGILVIIIIHVYLGDYIVWFPPIKF